MKKNNTFIIAFVLISLTVSYANSEETVKERLVRVEETVKNLDIRLSQRIDDTNKQIDLLRQDMNKQNGLLRQDVNRRFDEIDRRFDETNKNVEQRFINVDQSFETVRALIYVVIAALGSLIAAICALVVFFARDRQAANKPVLKKIVEVEKINSENFKSIQEKINSLENDLKNKVKQIWERFEQGPQILNPA